MIFGKKKEARCEEITKLEERVNVLTYELNKLKRILQYSKTKPSFHMEKRFLYVDSYLWFRSPRLYTYDLYLYINGNEYVIEDLESNEFSFAYITDDKCELSIHDDVATFIVNLESFIFEFAIDYKNGTYILMRKQPKESEE